MDAVEPADWTLDQHLAAGATAISQIETDHITVAPEPVCHHFDAIHLVDPMEISVEATHRHLVPQFAAIGVDFMPDGLEAWETVKPQHGWLQLRVPAIFAAAKKAGLVYQGWTWEPDDRQPIAASRIQLINNRAVSRHSC